MNKPKGGRGKRASYNTKVVRLPELAAEYGEIVAQNMRDLIENDEESRELFFTVLEKQQSVEIAKDILLKKRSAKVSMKLLLQAMYKSDVDLRLWW